MAKYDILHTDLNMISENFNDFDKSFHLDFCRVFLRWCVVVSLYLGRWTSSKGRWFCGHQQRAEHSAGCRLPKTENNPYQRYVWSLSKTHDIKFLYFNLKLICCYVNFFSSRKLFKNFVKWLSYGMKFVHVVQEVVWYLMRRIFICKQKTSWSLTMVFFRYDYLKKNTCIYPCEVLKPMNYVFLQ